MIRSPLDGFEPRIRGRVSSRVRLTWSVDAVRHSRGDSGTVSLMTSPAGPPVLVQRDRAVSATYRHSGWLVQPHVDEPVGPGTIAQQVWPRLPSMPVQRAHPFVGLADPRVGHQRAKVHIGA